MDYIFEKAIQQWLSKGIAYIGLEKTVEILKKFKLRKENTVSIGSGNGVFERILKDKQVFDEIICVDPVFNEFCKVPVDLVQVMCLPPKYQTVDLLIKNEPNLVRDCVALINWAPPGPDGFDLEAIEKLLPKWVIIIGEFTMCTAGSFKLHRWLINKVCKTQDIGNGTGKKPLANKIYHSPEYSNKVSQTDINLETTPLYKVEFIHKQKSFDSNFPLTFEILILQRVDSEAEPSSNNNNNKNNSNNNNKNST
jgi:hypothetical protein